MWAGVMLYSRATNIPSVPTQNWKGKRWIRAFSKGISAKGMQ